MQTMKPKARDTPDGSRSATGAQNAWSVVLFALQCAQRIGQWITLLFIAHVAASLAATLINPELEEPLADFMESCRPVYQLGIGAYFTKAAVENVLKIQQNVASIKTYTDKTVDTEDTSNG